MLEPFQLRRFKNAVQIATFQLAVTILLVEKYFCHAFRAKQEHEECLPTASLPVNIIFELYHFFSFLIFKEQGKQVMRAAYFPCSSKAEICNPCCHFCILACTFFFATSFDVLGNTVRTLLTCIPNAWNAPIFLGLLLAKEKEYRSSNPSARTISAASVYVRWSISVSLP